MIHEVIVADTKFDGNLYFATRDQVEEANIYVVDPDGLSKLVHNYKGDKILLSFYIRLDEETRRQRMKDRGDSDELIEKRIKNDRERFNMNAIETTDWFLDGRKTTKQMARTIMRFISVFFWVNRKVVGK